MQGRRGAAAEASTGAGVGEGAAAGVADRLSAGAAGGAGGLAGAAGAAAPLPQGGAVSQRAAQLDALADQRDLWRAKNRSYYDSITRLVKFVVPEGSSVLEVGCGTGDLLAALRPSRGVGVDLSPRQLAIAGRKHPHLTFLCNDGHTGDLADLPGLSCPQHGATFDYVVLADTVGYVEDVWALFRSLAGVCHERTRIFVSYYNFVWEPALRLASRVGLRMPVPPANWLGMADLDNLLDLNHFEVVKRGVSTLVPVEVPGVAALCNRYLVHLPGVRHLALTHYFVARPRPRAAERSYSCSVVVPCRNERGNISDIVSRVPAMGHRTEVLFVDGNSEDGTVAQIEDEMRKNRRPDLTLRLLHQGDGKGKGDAVRKGFAAAEGELLFILDADMTVPPEDLPKFYLAVAEGKGEFINGSRLVYPMEGEAMRLLNLFGNRFFGWALSGILGQRLKDTLCGTKVLRQKDYERVKGARAFLGEFDPFGDFDLIFGAAKSHLKIVEMPIRYRARTYGETKIHRFSHGFLLLRMTAHAFRKFRV